MMSMTQRASPLQNFAHPADVRALQFTEFHVAHAANLLRDDPATILYVALLLAQRLDASNRTLIEIKSQLESGHPIRSIAATVQRADELLNFSGGASLVYAGYPYDPLKPVRP